MSCPICGVYFDDFEHEQKYSKDLDITVCEDCLTKVEEHHKVTGKYVVTKCKTCHKIDKVEFIKYKKRGRVQGIKMPPKKEKGLVTLDRF